MENRLSKQALNIFPLEEMQIKNISIPNTVLEGILTDCFNQRIWKKLAPLYHKRKLLHMAYSNYFQERNGEDYMSLTSLG